MTEKKFNLAMIISANAKQAMEELRRLNNFVDVITSPNQITNGIGMGMSAVKGIASAAIAPMKLFGGAALAAGGSLTAFSIGAMKAAAGDQQMTNRLEALYGSGQKAAEVFEELEKFGRQEGIDTEELLDAKIILEQIGVKGSGSLKAVARTAYVMNMSMAEVANGIATLSDRSFKKMGIDIAREGENYVLTFTDKMGKVQKVAAEGAAAAQAALLGIMIEKSNETDLGFGRLLKSLSMTIMDMYEDFGKPMLKAGEDFIRYLRDHFETILQSGVAEKFGEMMAGKLEGIVDHIMAAFQTLPAITESLKNLFSGDAKGLKTILKDAAMAFGEVAMVAIANSLSAMGSIFVGFGKLIAGAFMEEILQLPGMGGIRNKRAQANIESSAAEDLIQIADTFGIRYSGDKEGIRGALKDELKTRANVNLEAALASMNKGDLLKNGFQQFMTALPNAFRETSQYADTRFGQVNDTVAGVTGVDWGASLNANLNDIRARRSSGQPIGPPIIIHNLEIKANDTREMTNQLMQRGGLTAAAPAGT